MVFKVTSNILSSKLERKLREREKQKCCKCNGNIINKTYTWKRVSRITPPILAYMKSLIKILSFLMPILLIRFSNTQPCL